MWKAGQFVPPFLLLSFLSFYHLVAGGCAAGNRGAELRSSHLAAAVFLLRKHACSASTSSRRAGRGLFVLTVAISVYHIAKAEDKVRATANEV
ncbi:MAG: hypothetical protein CSA09_04975, partial [Candidatus Contendobacter odensis]